MKKKKQMEKIQQTPLKESGKTTMKQPVDHFKDVKYKDGKVPVKDQIIEIQIFRKPHDACDYLHGESPPPSGIHYYIFYAEAAKNRRPRNMIELDKKRYREEYTVTKNCVSTEVVRGQKIKWICRFPFTIYYGGTSIITTDKQGWPRPRQILPYLKAQKKGTNYYATQDVYIVNNALSGSYKYFVAVYIPPNPDAGEEGNIICVDDPESIIPPPR